MRRSPTRRATGQVNSVRADFPGFAEEVDAAARPAITGAGLVQTP